jgi:hypothetical protein
VSKTTLIEEVVAELRVTRRRYAVEPSRPSRPPTAVVDTTCDELPPSVRPMPLAKCGELAQVIPLRRKAAG